MLNNAAQQYAKSYDHYASIYKQFLSYEDIAVEFFADSKPDQRILTNPNAGDMATKLNDTIKCYKSPFAEAALWIKGEMLDIQGNVNGQAVPGYNEESGVNANSCSRLNRRAT
jgi:hypothetical protein